MRVQRYVWLRDGRVFHLVGHPQFVAVLTRSVECGLRWDWEIYRRDEWLKCQADVRAWHENDDATAEDLYRLEDNWPTPLRWGYKRTKAEVMPMATEALKEVCANV